MVKNCTKVEAQRLILALILIMVSVVFWALFEQAGSSMNLFAARNTDLSVGSASITASQVQSFNAGFILLFAPRSQPCGRSSPSCRRTPTPR
jgi:POT family proton-dependent oligopeptide transporter